MKDIKEKVIVITLALLILAGVFALGYRACELKHQGTTITTYAPEAIDG